MPKIKIVISREEKEKKKWVIVSERIITAESQRRLTAGRAARLLAQVFPAFRRRKGRFARFAGIEVLPVVESTDAGWCAWRLYTGDESRSGYEPPIPGTAGKINSTGNQYSDRHNGIWMRADVSEIITE
jgi:murein DD-endopeptidase MepM/ murein hydrolase activator NlpD